MIVGRGLVATALVLAAAAFAAAAGPGSRRPGGAWRAWNRPKVQRTALSLTALADGRILLAGGDFAPRPPRSPLEHSAEVLDPRTGIWSLTDPMPGHRVDYAIAPLPGGGALLAGGYDHLKVASTTRRRWGGGYRPPELSAAMLGSAQRWDPVRGWRSAGDMVERRRNPAASTLADGRVLVTGGDQLTYGPTYIDPAILTEGDRRFLATAEVWSPATDRWQSVAAMSQPRAGHTATTLADGRVLVVGGTPAEAVSGPTAVPAELWNPATGRWAPTARPRSDRQGHTATRLADGRVLVAGGSALTPPHGPSEGVLGAAEVWDPAGGRWTDASPMLVPRSDHSAVLLSDGRVLVAGGGPSQGEIWDPATNEWTATPAFTTFMDGNVRLAALSDGRVLLVSPLGVQLWTP